MQRRVLHGLAFVMKLCPPSRLGFSAMGMGTVITNVSSDTVKTRPRWVDDQSDWRIAFWPLRTPEQPSSPLLTEIQDNEQVDTGHDVGHPHPMREPCGLIKAVPLLGFGS